MKALWLTDQEAVAIEAALVFWRQVAENSRVHPSRSPAVSGLFKHHAPLDNTELEELIEQIRREDGNVVGLEEYIRVRGEEHDHRIRERVKFLGIRPVLQQAEAKFYRIRDLDRALYDA